MNRIPRLPEALTVRVCGVDEVGRGPLAGPVVAAAVVLDPSRPIAGLRDSKQLSARRRTLLAEEIRNRALDWSVASASVNEIDRLNILQASLLAMRRAILALEPAADLALIDGSMLPPLDLPMRAIVGGDATEASISAASILAKTVRDAWMIEQEAAFPGYGFGRSAGYPTPAHLAALDRQGPCSLHRMSFAPVRRALEARGMAGKACDGARALRDAQILVRPRAVDPAVPTGQT